MDLVLNIKGCVSDCANTPPWNLVVANCGLFSSGSFGSFSGSSSSGFSFGFGSCQFGFLLSHSFSFGFVFSFFCFQASAEVGLFAAGFGSFYSFHLRLLFALPSGEAAFSFSLVESAFFHTAEEVFHQHYALVGEDSAYSVGGLSTAVHPIQGPLEIESDCSRISVRIIRTYPFNKLTISWCPAIGDNNRIKRIVLATMAL